MSLINRETLLAEYDRVHVGEPGKARKLIEDAPTAEPERKKGRWIDDGTYGDYHPHHAWHCSECEESVIEIDTPWFKFCPNCGADMRGEKDETD